VGIFALASRSADCVTFVLNAFNFSFAPIAASLHAAGRRLELQRLLTTSSRALLLISVVVVVAFAFGSWMAFPRVGADFEASVAVAALLALGRLVNAATGSVGVLLIMTGHNASATRALTLGAVVTLTVGLLLIPEHGAIGAAIADVCSILVWNGLLVVSVIRALKLRPTAFASLKAL
jgi:O-antigen/teichoic acid export membrane protein